MPETGDIRIVFNDITNPAGGHGSGQFVVRASTSITAGGGTSDPITDTEMEDLAERIKGSDYMNRSFPSLDIENDMDTSIGATEDRIVYP